MSERLTYELLLTLTTTLKAQLENEKREVASLWERVNASGDQAAQCAALMAQVEKLSSETAGDEVRTTIERLGADADTHATVCAELNKQLEVVTAERDELRKKLENTSPEATQAEPAKE